MIENQPPHNDNQPHPPYRFNWWECFVCVACVAIAVFIIYHGIIALTELLVGWL